MLIFSVFVVPIDTPNLMLTSPFNPIPIDRTRTSNVSVELTDTYCWASINRDILCIIRCGIECDIKRMGHFSICLCVAEMQIPQFTFRSQRPGYYLRRISRTVVKRERQSIEQLTTHCILLWAVISSMTADRFAHYDLHGIQTPIFLLWPV